MHLLTSFLVFAALICVSESVDPVVEISDTNPPRQEDTGRVIATRDQDVTFSCFIENHRPDSNVVWEYHPFNGGAERLVSTNQDLEDNVNYGIEKPTTKNTWRLRIRSVAVSDEGTYVCFTLIAQQIKVTASVTLIVYVPPIIEPSQTSSDMSVDAGDTVVFRCNATGRPTPTIIWERQGKALLPIGLETFMNYSMTARNIQPQHRGLYKCLAVNLIGATNREIVVNVRFKPQIEPIHEDLSQKVGYVIELQCLIRANPDPDEEELSWYRGTTPFSVSAGRYEVKILRMAFNSLMYELIIHGVQREDFGEYRCAVRNDIGRSSGSILLRESDHPQDSVKFGRPIAAGVSLRPEVLLSLTLTLAALLFTQ